MSVVIVYEDARRGTGLCLIFCCSSIIDGSYKLRRRDLSSVSGLSIDSEPDVDEEDEIDQVDTASNRSYNGSDTDYYELKAERKERKLELQETRERNKQAKDGQRAFDRDKEREVQE
ncbi:hypothetical protein ACJ73_10296, partial [Blastomyces percursus]